MLMSLGMFGFELATLPYQELIRRTSWKHARSPRFGAFDASQYVGPGEDRVTLSGVLLPPLAGSYSSLRDLRVMADDGEAWPLMDANGTALGVYTIESIDERQSYHLDNGVPRKVDFTIELNRVG